MSGYTEREVKLRVEGAEAARAALAEIGARPLRPRRLQADVVFDTPDRDLMLRGDVLRVRSEDGAHCLTFKSPLPHATMKLREELETSVSDGRLLMTIFERLGFAPSFRYEKYREEFSVSDVVVAIDETPVGTFIEIEGSAEGIIAVTLALGRQPSEFVLDSYRSLFLQACAAAGTPATDMLFAR